MKTKIAVTKFDDRRSPELMRHSDSIEEKRWRARVALNAKELSRGRPVVVPSQELRPAELSMMLRRQAT